jgi:hypothetical protein
MPYEIFKKTRCDKTGCFGHPAGANAVSAGRAGGRKTSKRKALSSSLNGQKGGRPKKLDYP